MPNSSLRTIQRQQHGACVIATITTTERVVSSTGARDGGCRVNDGCWVCPFHRLKPVTVPESAKRRVRRGSNTVEMGSQDKSRPRGRKSHRDCHATVDIYRCHLQVYALRNTHSLQTTRANPHEMRVVYRIRSNRIQNYELARATSVSWPAALMMDGTARTTHQLEGVFK